MLKSIAFLFAFSLFAPAQAPAPVTPAVQAALEELHTLVQPKGNYHWVCSPPKVWKVNPAQGDTTPVPELLAAYAKTVLEQYRWELLDHGPIEHGYGFIADPDPSDPHALAFGVLLEQESLVVLERCQAEPS